PLTGSELVDWRKREGLSQSEAAKRLDVGIATIKRAEAGGESHLGPALAKAFAKLSTLP
ncbi:MAG: helix-turn-helix domain-containing protein, partial [Sandaracinaceae bacterium]|nr:helix-turn-helix domain-containing protein [Sandaracinaceae bacterium]